MKKRFLGIFLMLAMVLALAVNVSAAATCTVSFTCPSDVTVRVAKGFAAGVDDSDGVEIAGTSVSTEGDTSTYVFQLEAGNYRFLAQDKAGAASDKYYNWDKNFLVTADDVANGTKTIDADPGLLANTGFEQKRSTASYYVREYTDELLASEAATVSDALKAKYPYVFTTPTFTVEGKARHQFSTQAEVEAFVADWDDKTDYMTTYVLGQTNKSQGGNIYDLRLSVFTTEDLTGKTLEQAAAAVQANGKPTILIQAQMHGDEQSGTEGTLGTVAMLCGEYGAAAIETVNILVIPRVNPAGSEIYKYESGAGSGWRNVNRDAMEATQPETKMLINCYNLFEPEVCLDHHEFRATTDSTSGHLDDLRLSEIVTNNVPSELRTLQYQFVDYIFDALEEDGLRAYYYRASGTPTGAVTMKSYYSARGSISLLAEIPGQRKGSQQWERRVLTHNLTARGLIDYVVANADTVNKTVNDVKAEIATYGSTFTEENPIVIGHADGTALTPNRYIFDLRYGTFSKITNNAVYIRDETAYSRPRPIYYVVPKDAAKIEKVLGIADIHGIEYSEIEASEVMELRGYTGTYKAAALAEPKLYSFVNGAYKFRVAQKCSNILCLLMEPDIYDAQDSADYYKASFVMQGNLAIDEIYRCENDSEHDLTYVPAKGATCDSVGYHEHYICICGKAFAANEHVDALAEEDYIIPVSGHDFVEQADGSFACSFGCGTTETDLHAAVAACDGIGGTVKLSGTKALTEALVVPAGVTLDLGEWMLEAPAGLVVNEGSAITNGNICISKTSGAVVNLGSNGGWVPVCYADNAGEALYALYPAAAKTGKDVAYFDNGTRYSFGYKLESPYGDNAYEAVIDADAFGAIKVGVNVSLQAGGIDADYSFSQDTVAKMSEVGTGADDFFKVNLSLTGEKVDDVVVTPYIKVKALGFRLEGSKSTDFIPVTEVATFGGVNYTSLEAAVAAAEAVGGEQEIALIGDVTFKRPTTIKMNGQIRFVVNGGKDVTISGPVTFDGQNVEANTILFRCTGTASKLTLERGVTIQNYNNVRGDTETYKSFGAIRVDTSSTLVLDGVTLKNNTNAVRGVVYCTATARMEINNCVFENNTATKQYGGALAIYKTAGTTVKNTVFRNNSCATFGGAIGMSSYNVAEGPVIIENCTFTGNSAGSSSFGGAIAVNAGALEVNGVTMSGNTVGSTANDIEVAAGTFALSGNVAIERIKLASEKTIAINSALDAAKAIEIDATVNTVVLSGGKVADACTKFVGVNGEAVDAEGYLGGKPSVINIAAVGGRQYASLVDAVAAATELAATTTDVTIDVFGDETFTEAATIKLPANVQLSFSDSVTLEGPLTIDGQNLSRTSKNSRNPLVVVASDSAANGKTLTLKGVTVCNFHIPVSTGSSGNYCAALRTNAYNTIVLDGATLTGNKGEIGGVYITSNGSLIVKNNSVISNNESLAGFNQGVVFLNGTSSSLTASDSTFSGNVSATRGVIAALGKKSSITNCTFENNSGSALSVIHMRNSGTLPVTGCTFKNNTTTAADGAAVYCEKGTVNVSGCTFSGNTQDTYAESTGTINVSE